MTPKEKAEDLLFKFKSINASLICVNEILNILDDYYTARKYWEAVKSEIEAITL